MTTSRPSPEALAAAVEIVRDLPPPCPLALERIRPIIRPAWRRLLAERAAEAERNGEGPALGASGPEVFVDK